MKNNEKKTVKYPIKIENNKTIQDQQDIIKEYKNYYEKLLNIRKAESEEEKEPEKKVEEKFKKLIAEAEAKPRKILTEEMVEIAMKEMKNKKASYRHRWKAE